MAVKLALILITGVFVFPNQIDQFVFKISQLGLHVKEVSDPQLKITSKDIQFTTGSDGRRKMIVTLHHQ